MRLAAVDIGTNTVRLLVADGTERLRHGREITRLGQGVDDARRLHPDAMERTLRAIERFVGEALELGAEHIRIAGTSVLRDADDRADFAAAIEERTGQTLEILSGAQEGRIAYLGATAELDDAPYVVCDIGGGSTELSLPHDAVSLDIGSVRLKERCLHGDPPTEAEVAAARETVDETLEEVALEVRGALVGVAGTITTLAAVVMNLGSYDADRVHLSRMTAMQVRDTTARLLSMTASEIFALGCVERGRADLIGGGASILDRVMERWGFEEVLVSERDILDGLVLDLAERLA